jgi:cytochrome c1
MNKVFNILFFLLILIFFFYTYKYYSSNKNLKEKHYNRKNINQIINNKITDLPVLLNDTDNIIEFNNSINEDKYNKKPRSFWNLLKSK